MKLRKIEILIIGLCAIAALLCGIGSSLAPYFFVSSSTIGIVDSKKNKVLSGFLINGIFLLLNLYNIIRQ